MSVVVLAEKPSVARDVARVLGATRRGEGFLEGSGYVVTWALGHLVRLAEPHEMRPEWKRWSLESLPLLPDEWPLKVSDETRAQFDVVRKLLRAPDVSEVVAATDAGREGELIFRYIYAASGCTRPVRRLWISSLTLEAIKKGLATLRPLRDFDPLADAAHGRARADWLVGMNLSRAATLRQGELFSVGRVQTPTLALLAERERAIRAFVPRDYLEVVATFEPPESGGGPQAYQGTWFRGDKPDADSRRLAADGVEARAVLERVQGAPAVVEAVTAETRRVPPPLLYDLTDLQRHANRLYGLSAQKTLAIAQALYERHKLLTYPRTDSRHLSQDVAATLPDVVAAVAEPYRALLAPGTGERPLSRRFVDDTQVGDHHAILPTTTPAADLDLTADERRVYDLVCRRLLMAWHHEHVFAVTTVVTRVDSRAAQAPDRFHSSGTAVQQAGWKALEPPPARAPRGAAPRGDDAAQELPAGLVPGLARRVGDVETQTKRTRPPRRYTDATLLTAMETAGAALDDRELSRAMKEHGLGTPATRAETIETLLRRGYLERDGKALVVTETGLRLIDSVDPRVKSAAMTGAWEAQLERIRRGEERLDAFMERIAAFVREVVGAPRGALGEREGAVAPPDSVEASNGNSRQPRTTAQPPDLSKAVVPRNQAPAREDAPSPRSAPLPARERETPAPPSVARPAASPSRLSSQPAASPSPPAVLENSPPASHATTDLPRLLREMFRLPSFRPHQEEVCQAVVAGADVLLVMPTGAGKSLCYQLPGLARGGTTLVVSPLIALMEDQVAKLQELGLKAERIHSGRPRGESRAVCYEYLAGRLDFLFIAPERLRVPGFPEFLARRKPVLVAIDEAHCISEWGHDFRPDYRLLGERLPALRPAPVIAMTATATPRVQKDIAEQLGLASPRRFIHGFRRTNIAIEIATVKLGAERTQTALEVLRVPERRPAIVYAPTRKAADELGRELAAAGLRATTYHAGMGAAARERAQAAFLGGELEVVVATIAFGMGVDKADVRTVIHTGLPGSLEGYYQEIGRAGRDGRPSRALLLYSYADRRTHEFFFERDYPEPEVLARVARALTGEAQPLAEVQRRSRVPADEFEAALGKLWAHGGALVDGELARAGHDRWQASYLRQRAHKQAQLDEMLRCAQSHGCRMLYLLRHFGDQGDLKRPCGQCDACAPADSLVRRWRAPDAREAEILGRVLTALRERDRQSTGQLHRESGAESSHDRRAFEELLGGLQRAGLVRIERDEFEKDGRTITFQRVSLTPEGDDAVGEALHALALEDAAAGPARPTRGPGKGKDKRKDKAARALVAPPADAPPEALVTALKAWRLAEARKRGVPAFHILTDRVLLALASERPDDEEGLLAVRGIGPRLVERHGAAWLDLLRAHR